jgi:hypothetical protein
MLCDSCMNRHFEEPGASNIRVTGIGELGILAINSNERMLRRNTHGVTSQETAFFLSFSLLHINSHFSMQITILP